MVDEKGTGTVVGPAPMRIARPEGAIESGAGETVNNDESLVS